MTSKMTSHINPLDAIVQRQLEVKSLKRLLTMRGLQVKSICLLAGRKRPVVFHVRLLLLESAQSTMVHLAEC